MNKRDRQQRIWENSMDLYAAAAATAAEAWARVKNENTTLKTELRKKTAEAERLRRYIVNCEDFRHKQLQEINAMQKTINELENQLQERDMIIDNIAATHNPLLIAELIDKKEGA